MIGSGTGATRRRRFGSASRLAAFLAILLAAILSVTAYETGRAFTNQSVASTTRTLVSEVDSFSRATGSSTPASLESATVQYLQGRVLVQGESLLIGLSSGRRFGSAGSGALLATPAVRRLLGTPPVGHLSLA